MSEANSEETWKKVAYLYAPRSTFANVGLNQGQRHRRDTRDAAAAATTAPTAQPGLGVVGKSLHALQS